MARHNPGESNQEWKKIIHVIAQKSCNLIRKVPNPYIALQQV